MTHRPPVVLALLALLSMLLLGSCEKRKPSVTKKPAGSAAVPPDSLISVGGETAGLVKMWVLALSVVETEESAATAATRLDIISAQFDGLVERAEKLPKLDPAEFKRIDREVEVLLSQAASGLESERKRIFVLPAEIKDKVLPAHQQLLEKFRAMGRAIRDTRATEPPAKPLDAPSTES
jgi:hypothetical protein